MRVLIVESTTALARLWARHLQRQGATVFLAGDEDEAVDILTEETVDVVVLDLVLDRGSAIAVADVARFRQPLARVVFVTNTTFFSDGSIFQHIPNACAFLSSGLAPEDLAAVIDHYGVPS